MTLPLLTILGVTPIVGALLTFALRGRAARLVGLAFCALTLGVALSAVFLQGNHDLSEQVMWIRPIGAWYALSLDGLSKAMVLLSAVLAPAALIVVWHLSGGDPFHDIELAETDADVVPPKQWSGTLFTPLVLLLQGLSLFVFMANDLLLFFLFFEASLVPMYFLIAGWGGIRRGPAALKFLLFSLGGGLILLGGVIAFVVYASGQLSPSLLLTDLSALSMPTSTARLVFWAFFVAFAIKAPLVPVHSWLPDVAAQANPAATVLLVGVLDKIGAYGMIRFCLNLMGEQAKEFAFPILIIALVSIIYGAFAAIGSRNIMRLVAFTSISHFGFMVFGLFAFTTASVTGSMLYMFAHGLSAAALLLCAGYLVARTGTVQIGEFAGVGRKAPVLAGCFLMAGLATLSLPGFANFAGELMVLTGAWQRYPVLTVLAVAGTLLAAIYVMLVYQRTMTGELSPALAARFDQDLTYPERSVVAVLLGLLLVFGLAPNLMARVVAPTADQTMSALQLDDPQPTVREGR